MNFDQAFDVLLGHEGGYSNHPSDPGGETMWGVTLRVARENGYTGSMRDLPRSTAKVIYRRKYWDAVSADELPADVRLDVFDASVNSGPGQAAKWLQRAAGATPDGVIGAQTIAKTRAMNGAKLSAAFNADRLEFMTSLPSWPAFGKGWARRIASNLRQMARL